MSSFLAAIDYDVPMSTKRLPFGEWLREQLDKRGWTVSDLAARMSVQPSTISRYVNGDREPQGQYIQRIANGLEITPQEVLYAAGIINELPQSLEDYEHNREIKRLAREVHELTRKEIDRGRVWVTSYGRVPAFDLRWQSSDTPEGATPVRVPAQYVRRALDELFVVQADGDCLKPEGIKDRDLVLCRKISTGAPNDKDIVVARVGDDITIKVFRRIGDWIELHDGAGNRVYRVSIMNAEELHIIGVYLYRWDPSEDDESAQ